MRTPEKTAAEKVIERFGSHQKVAEALSDYLGRKVHTSTIYRWTYPAERHGSDGEVPSWARKILRQAARLHGVVVTREDLA